MNKENREEPHEIDEWMEKFLEWLWTQQFIDINELAW